ncbi:hypothetical protein ABPG74_004679 [Tetrahymena malaccensis]
MIGLCSNLKILALNLCHNNFGYEAILDLTSGLNRCLNLKSLTFGIVLCDNNMSPLCSNLAQIKCLTTLTFNGINKQMIQKMKNRLQKLCIRLINININ